MLAATRRTVDPGREQTAGNRRAQQQVIDAQPGVAGKRVPEILPERVDPLIRVERPQRVGPALRDQAAVGVTHLRPEQRVIDPALGRIDIQIGRPRWVSTGSALRARIATPFQLFCPCHTAP